MKIEYEKIDEIANRLRQYEEDGKAHYFNIEYNNGTDEDGKSFKIAEKLSGEQAFRKKIYYVLNSLKPDEIIVTEFTQKSRNGKPVNKIVIDVNNEPGETPPVHYAIQQPSKGKSEEKSKSGQDDLKIILQRVESLGQNLSGEETIRQKAYTEYALKNELERKDEKIKKLEEEIKKLTFDVEELNGDNTKLYKYNEELVTENRKLQKFVPDNITVAGVSITKMLGSILGTATETLVRNVVTKKPDTIKSFLGETGLNALSGIFEDTDETSLPENQQVSEGHQELQKVEPLTPEQEDKLKIIGIIHDVNNKATTEQLGRIQLLYYHILDDDESINDDNLLALAKFAHNQYNEKQDTGDSASIPRNENKPETKSTETSD
jgi:hypothetical protein